MMVRKMIIELLSEGAVFLEIPRSARSEIRSGNSPEI
jgi:hypothetical protein